jgi:hypothetical protein
MKALIVALALLASAPPRPGSDGPAEGRPAPGAAQARQGEQVAQFYYYRIRYRYSEPGYYYRIRYYRYSEPTYYRFRYYYYLGDTRPAAAEASATVTA